MKVRNIYPEVTRQNMLFMKARHIARYLFIAAAIICALVNIRVKGKAWSLVVIWALLSVWELVFSPDAIEFNFISQSVKIMLYTVVLLAIIDYFLAPGWAEFVIPIIIFSTVIFAAVVFFIDVHSQMKNTMPIIWVVVCSLLAAAVYAISKREMNWPMIVLVCVSLSMLIAFIFFNEAFILELKKRFHTNKHK